MVPLRAQRSGGRRDPPARHRRPLLAAGPGTPWEGEVDASYFEGWKEPEFSWEEQIRQKIERTYLPDWGKEQ